VQSVVSLPIGDNADPNRVSLEDAVERIEEEQALVLSPRDKLGRLAATAGDLSSALSAAALSELGAKVVEDYERDKADRKDWEDVAREALAACAQEEVDQAKTTPWPNASNMKYPLLTSAALQFNARMYPAVVKGDEAVLCKIVGQDNGRPKLGPNPQTGQMQPVPEMAENPQTGKLEPVMGPDGQMQPLWAVPPGAKAKRARRVSEYLNHTLFYKLESWEDDTDALLIQLPAVGCIFRKLWFDPDLGPQAATVSALRVYVPKGARNLRTTPRLTEEIPDVYPHEIIGRQRSGFYREIELSGGDDEKDGARLLLEQHRLIDLDDDGLPEPYIVTVDHESRLILRIEANYSPADVMWKDDRAVSIKRRDFYVKYGMFPHPRGDFYDIGLGHLLKRMGAVIDTAINQLLDAGTAQTAGGGFIGAGVRLQNRGQRGVIRMAPGEYKVVDVSGETLRQNIVERTLPNVSPVTFQVLDMILGAAKDIAGAKDVITGEASNTGQVGTTLALIEQGLQVFNAAAKRIFRALKAEYTLLFDNIARYGPQSGLVDDYQTVLDDPDADFEADFNAEDLDIRPVSDPAAITRMQKMARAQFIMGTMGQLQAVGGDPREALRRAYEAVDAEDIDKLLPKPQPNPVQEAIQQLSMAAMKAGADKDTAQAQAALAKALKDAAEAANIRFNLERDAFGTGIAMGAMNASIG
jgi:chaperonin GroES